MNELVEIKLIDTLAQKRTEFIELNVLAVMAHQKAVNLSTEIDYLIPRDNAGYIDAFGAVFPELSENLGENARNRIRPKEASIQHKSEEEIRNLTTKIVDGNMWRILFNRLGFYKNMSEEQQDRFKVDCKDNPQPFEVNLIKTTLASMLENSEPDLMEALFDTFTGLSAAYVSNDRRKFGAKVVIEDAFLEYGETFKLTSHEKLQTLLTIIWRWVFVNRWELSDKGNDDNQIWAELEEAMKASMQDYDEVRSLVSHGIEFRFFKKKTVHVIFPESMISILNDQLAKTSSLPAQ